MRLIATFTDRQEAATLAGFLNQNGIETTCEAQDGQVQVWIVEEEQLGEAGAVLEQFRANPKDPRFRTTSPTPRSQSPGRSGRRAQAKMGPATLILLIVCGLVFLLTGFTGLRQLPPYLQPFYGLDSPLAAKMLYDFPRHFEIEQQIVNQLNGAQLQLETPPPSVAPLIAEMNATPYWVGAYDEFLFRYNNPAHRWGPTAPLFEKIRVGEVWRLVTPIFLHANLLHIFFNMIWLVIVGSQVERRLGIGRYLLLTLIGAIIPNTAQYLMGGPFFLGYSGVITALVGYVWARQSRAPWEGYLLARATLIFVGLYVLGLFVLQLIAFIFALAGAPWALATGMANTAHLVGAATGYLLGRWNRFAR
jgi:GlpG protein